MARERVLSDLVERILEVRRRVAPARSVLVAVSGIDGCGKGFVTARIADALGARAQRVASVNIDGWLNLPKVRFDAVQPAENFYARAIRFDDLFAQLVLPLRERRSVRVEADFAAETATEFRRHTHEYSDVDVILLEGIFLLRPSYRQHYDFSIWIDCTFETALERALARAQEGLPPDETVRAYHTIYFPAEQIHLERDRPREAASMILPNDPRLEGDPRPSG